MLKPYLMNHAIPGNTSIRDTHESDARVGRSKCEAFRGVSSVHAEDTPLHIANNANYIASFVVKHPDFIPASASCKHHVLLSTEQS